MPTAIKCSCGKTIGAGHYECSDCYAKRFRERYK
jgi:hypothetical protein